MLPKFKLKKTVESNFIQNKHLECVNRSKNVSLRVFAERVCDFQCSPLHSPELGRNDDVRCEDDDWERRS